MGKSADYDWFKVCPSNFPYNKDNWVKFADQQKLENKKSPISFPIWVKLQTMIDSRSIIFP
jgi:hypothetical protein